MGEYKPEEGSFNVGAVRIAVKRKMGHVTTLIK